MEGNENKRLKTGTTTVAIVCKEGIVMAADRRSTAGYFIADKDVEKVVKITDDIAVTTAGLVSDVQLIVKLVRAELKLKQIRAGKNSTVKEAANLTASIIYQNIRKFSPVMSIVGFLLAGKDRFGYKLYQLGVDGSITESKTFRSDGSGCLAAFGVLDTLYKEGINLQEGISLVKKAINAAIQRDAASGEGIDIYTITEKGVQKVLGQKIETKIQ